MLDSTLKGCDAAQAYYGFGKPPDPAAALRCALYQRDHPKETAEPIFSGPGILSMLYASGMAVPRVDNQAIRFACELKSVARAEREFRIGHVEKLRATGPATSNFDLCDDVTSGFMMGACASIQESFAEAKRQQELERITARWPVQARTRCERDRSGTARNAFEIVEAGKLRDQFLINLRRFGSGDIPQAVPLDEKLNVVYREAIGRPPAGTIDSEGIRKPSRRGSKCATSGSNSRALPGPACAPGRIDAQLVRLRIHQLESLLY